MTSEPAQDTIVQRTMPGIEPVPHAKSRARLATWLAGGMVLILCLVINLRQVPDTRFHPDESRWIDRADYLSELLHPTSAFWEERYLTRGQPPVGSYVTGLGLLLQGRDLDTNGPWDFRYGNEDTVTWNIAYGNMPTWDDLVAARRTSAAVGALTAVLLFATVTMLTNWLGGLAAGLFFAIHPLSRYLGTLATSDALFTMLFALSLLCAARLAQRPTWGRAILLGVVLGLGAGTKLSPLFVAVALAGFGGLLLALRSCRRIPGIGSLIARLPGLDAPHLVRLTVLLVALPIIATTTFVVTYPYLWPAPIERTQNLLEFRKREMENQARIWPRAAIDTRIEAIDRLWRNLENQYSATGQVIQRVGHALGRDIQSRGVDLPIAAIGLLALLVIAWRRGTASPAAVTTALLAAQGAIILVGIKIDFNRYYLPLVLVTGFGIGVFVAVGWALLLALLRRRTRRASPGTHVVLSEHAAR